MTIYILPVNKPVWIVGINEPDDSNSIGFFNHLTVHVQSKDRAEIAHLKVVGTKQFIDKQGYWHNREFPKSLLSADSGLIEINQAILHVKPDTLTIPPELKKTYGYQLNDKGRWIKKPLAPITQRTLFEKHLSWNDFNSDKYFMAVSTIVYNSLHDKVVWQDKSGKVQIMTAKECYSLLNDLGYHYTHGVDGWIVLP